MIDCSTSENILRDRQAVRCLPCGMEIKSVVLESFRAAFAERQLTPKSPITDDLVLLNSGLDSLAFAAIVTDLDDKLGYDPFMLMDQPVYPRTFGEFVSIYERFSDHRRS